MAYTHKIKILNDPIYGFITMPAGLLFEIMEHPYFQRLRRISQLGLTYLVYPGAYHTRFHHALGAMHLMQKAIELLRTKNHPISDEEAEAVLAAILLHDIGHGPFSHALEQTLIQGVHHENLSLQFMEALNEEFEGRLSMAIAIFQNRYPKKFLHQLISSQLDVDRLDYLRRDSFYTGVSEGQVNTERLITMLNVKNDHLVVDHKGIYSVEKFIVARRLMYWQVYLHKTVLAAEFLILRIVQRAREVYDPQMSVPAVLRPFISKNLPADTSHLLKSYALLDDYDLMAAFKDWSAHPDPVLARLCQMLLHRRLPGVRVQERPFGKNTLDALRSETAAQLAISAEDAHYFTFAESINNTAYDTARHRINLLHRDGSTQDFLEASDQNHLHSFTKSVQKYFLFAPKEILVNR